MKTLLAVFLLTGSVMANDKDALWNQIVQGVDQSSAREHQQADESRARMDAAEAATQARNNNASVVNAINGASAFSTTANPYQPIPVH